MPQIGGKKKRSEGVCCEPGTEDNENTKSSPTSACVLGSCRKLLMGRCTLELPLWQHAVRFPQWFLKAEVANNAQKWRLSVQEQCTQATVSSGISGLNDPESSSTAGHANLLQDWVWPKLTFYLPCCCVLQSESIQNMDLYVCVFVCLLLHRT